MKEKEKEMPDLRTPREKRRAELDQTIVDCWSEHAPQLLKIYSKTRVVNHIADILGLSPTKVFKTIRQNDLWESK